MDVRQVTLHRARCKHPGCRFEVNLREPILEGESRTEECPDGHKAEYRTEDVRSWTNEVRVGRF